MLDSKSFNEDGFSLLDIVSAIGIVLIFTMVGFFSFSGLISDSRQRAVEVAADTVYTKAYGYLLDENPSTDPYTVDDEYNLSQKDKRKIITDIRDLGNDRIKVTAFLDDHTAVRITPSSGDGSIPSTPEEGNDGSSELPPVIGQDTLTNFSYRCDSDRVGYLPILNISDTTKVYMWEKGKKTETFKEVKYSAPNSAMINAGEDFLMELTREEMARTKALYESDFDWNYMYQTVGVWNADLHTQAQKDSYSIQNTVQNVSEQVIFKAGVDYSIMYDGDVETFAAPGKKRFIGSDNTGVTDCLRSIDNLGNSTNLKNIIYIGGTNLTNVPDSIPSTVVNLRGAFSESVNFNDPSVSNWDTSNVVNIRSVFYNATSFNQPLDKWDVSNVRVAHMTFRSATSFNQNLSSWNTSKLEYATSMFYSAESFNNGCSKNSYNCALTWETDNLTEAKSMFYNAKSFNQNVSAFEENGKNYWNMSSVKDITSMFRDASSFNNGEASGESNKPMNWDFTGTTSFSRTFQGTTSFNQDMNTSIIGDVTNKTYFHLDSGLSCSNIPAKLLTANTCNLE